MFNQKGFSKIVLIIVVLILIGLGIGGFYYLGKNKEIVLEGKCGDNICDEFEKANTNFVTGDIYKLKVDVSGAVDVVNKVESDDGKINCGSDCSENYTSAKSVTLTASNSHKDGFYLKIWQGCKWIRGKYNEICIAEVNKPNDTVFTRAVFARISETPEDFYLRTVSGDTEKTQNESNQWENLNDYTPRSLFSSQNQIEKLEIVTMKIGENGGVIKLTDGTRMSISSKQLPYEMEFLFYSLNEILKKSFETNRSYLPIVGVVKIFVDADKTRFFKVSSDKSDKEINNEANIEVLITLIAKQLPGTKLEVVKPNMSSSDWAETGLFAVVGENGLTATFTVKKPGIYGLLSGK